ncbi:hypothetical protein [Flagellimonas sp. S3867]|uniref:hypothetical protein n=1 Tax=Flagellimonas sp. S3867 TaxID=2768063 RepID=UPI001686D70B|nr:hypothetical protein [Flagellimonas sp. S3867]
MAEQPSNQNNSDEIDLGQLFQLIGKGFNKMGVTFLRLFLYLKKNAFILVGLIIVGFAIGYGLNKITTKKKKIEVIVKPNLDSENYLYDVVEQINNNIKSKDTLFFESIGIPISNLAQFKVSVEPIEQERDKKGDLEYLELLEKFQDNGQFSDVIRVELLSRSAINHRITFFYKNSSEGQVFAPKAMAYINSNSYYEELVEISKENAIEKIKENETLINQIDGLINAYSQNLAKNNSSNIDGRIVLEGNEKMDVTGLFRLKNSLILDMERKKLEIKEQDEPLSIVNFGNAQEVKTSFFGKTIVLVPVILVIVFFLGSFLKYINKMTERILN